MGLDWGNCADDEICVSVPGDYICLPICAPTDRGRSGECCADNEGCHDGVCSTCASGISEAPKFNDNCPGGLYPAEPSDGCCHACTSHGDSCQSDVECCAGAECHSGTCQACPSGVPAIIHGSGCDGFCACPGEWYANSSYWPPLRVPSYGCCSPCTPNCLKCANWAVTPLCEFCAPGFGGPRWLERIASECVACPSGVSYAHSDDVCPKGFIREAEDVEPAYCCKACPTTGYPAQLPATLEVTFQPSQIGLTADWQTGVVSAVAPGGQAQQHGVQAQSVIERVNGKDYTETSMLDALSGGEPYTLVFQPPLVPCPQGYSVVDTCADCQKTEALVV